ncbi:PREDICTED: cyclin-dependent kinase B1-1-like [Camelina sativa]|uniref:Cyclin-dependent kinase B1-1-like n=1 Tax=Camelina sativa TaxID=90675 RepID=A0ABM0WW09_CAMSA|nr:PREDICTED: cyclin-dependent kinase B1-1-like [Camelina sativa]
MFSVLGTPTEQQWLGVTSLINWNSFPDWHPKDQGSAFPSLSPQGVDLLTKLLKLNPAERISAKAALDHSYFDSLDKSTF